MKYKSFLLLATLFFSSICYASSNYINKLKKVKTQIFSGIQITEEANVEIDQMIILADSISKENNEKQDQFEGYFIRILEAVSSEAEILDNKKIITKNSIKLGKWKICPLYPFC